MEPEQRDYVDVAIEQYEASFKAAEAEARQKQAAQEEAQRLQDEANYLQWKSTEELADMLVQRVDDLIQLYEVVCKPNTQFFHKCGSTIKNIAGQLKMRAISRQLQVRLQVRAMGEAERAKLQGSSTPPVPKNATVADIASSENKWLLQLTTFVSMLRKKVCYQNIGRRQGFDTHFPRRPSWSCKIHGKDPNKKSTNKNRYKKNRHDKVEVVEKFMGQVQINKSTNKNQSKIHVKSRDRSKSELSNLFHGINWHRQDKRNRHKVKVVKSHAVERSNKQLT